jgi:isopentenyl-diphosphate delta-isomerase
MERKKDHIEIALNQNVKADYNYWDDVKLVHQALPELDMDEIDFSQELFGKKLRAPIIISAMTGGYEDAGKINRNLAEAATKLQIGMGVGSQRAAIEDKKWEKTYSVVKEYNVPLLIANLGIPQFIKQGKREPYGLDEAMKAMEMINADVLAIHLNYLQEVIQPEGDTYSKGSMLAIKKLASKLPILIKETGAGISKEIALEVKRSRVKGIDVGGLGGTSFSAVEYYRAKSANDKKKERLGTVFWNWGIPTPVSVVMADVGLPLIATGGIRSGLDVARAICMGANAAGIASHVLKAAKESSQAVEQILELAIEELKASMLLTASKDLSAMSRKNCIVTGRTAEWFRSLGMT